MTTTRKEVQNLMVRKESDLEKLATTLGYRNVSEFFDDNPGALQAIKEFVLDNTKLDDDCSLCEAPLDHCDCDDHEDPAESEPDSRKDLE